MKEIQMDPEGVTKAGGLTVVALILIIGVSTSFYTIDPQETGVVLRLGQYTKQPAPPGFHFKLPFWIDKVYKVETTTELKEEFGFQTAQASVHTAYRQGNFDDESIMVTGDLNIADVEWSTQYKVFDPFRYLFKVRNPTETFRAMNESVMREVVGDRTINEVLTSGRGLIEEEVKVKLQELAEQYDLGISVNQVIIQAVNPPVQVKDSWSEVNEAQQEKESTINRAQATYNEVIPKASGEAQKTIEEARGYAVARVNNAEGDAMLFKSVFEEYAKAPEVTRQRIYLETMEKVHNQAGRKVILDTAAQGLLPLLNLNPEGSK